MTEKNGRIWGYPNWRLPGLQEAIRAHRLPSFRALTALNSEDFYTLDRGTNYAQARYLCLYLQEKGLLQEFYRRVSTTSTDPTGIQTLQALIGDCQPQWAAWVLSIPRE